MKYMDTRREICEVVVVAAVLCLNGDRSSGRVWVGGAVGVDYLWDGFGRVLNVMDFIDKIDECLRFSTPIFIQKVCRGRFGGIELHGDLSQIIVIIEIILPSVVDNIPVAPSDIASVGHIAQQLAIDGPTSVDKAFAHLFPPVAVFVGSL